jgi:hypothetical protein
MFPASSTTSELRYPSGHMDIFYKTKKPNQGSVSILL